MRMFAEIISAQVDERNVKNRQTGEQEPTKVFLIHAVNKDFPDHMVKVTMWRDYEKLAPELLKGAVIQMIFRSIIPASGNYEKLDRITVNAENIQVEKTAQVALQEAQAELELLLKDGKNGAATKQTEAVNA